jgi:plastocyanin
VEHDRWFELVSAAADDQLDGAERAELDAHLVTCGSCRALLASFEHHRRSLRLTPPTDHGVLVGEVLGARERQITTTRRSRRQLLARTTVAFSAMAVVAAALLAFTMGELPNRRPSTLAADQVVIDARGTSFDHTHLRVQPGTTVDWHNAAGTTHQLVRRLGGATVAEALEPGQTESATFADPGVYTFYCEIHPEMAGTITVDA